MGAMPTVDGSPMCCVHNQVLEGVCLSDTHQLECGWCERGDHLIYENDPRWGHEAIPFDVAVKAAANVILLPLRFCRDCAAERPSRVFEDGGHTCMACGLSQDPSEPAKEE